MNHTKTETRPESAQPLSQEDICREAALQNARAIKWKGYSWRDHQISIIRLNYHIRELETLRDELLEACKSAIPVVRNARDEVQDWRHDTRQTILAQLQHAIDKTKDAQQ